MSISKRMIAAGLKDRPHPLAGWKSAAEWAQLNGAPLVTEPGDEVRPSAIEGWVAISTGGRTRYCPARKVEAEKPGPAKQEQLSLF